MPKKIGSYELGKTLGKGGYSKVKLGKNIDTDVVVAVKIIDKSILSKGTNEKHLRREIAVMKKINHPHVVSLHEVLQTTKNIYLALEYIDGGDVLDALIQAKIFSETRARRYFQQLICGLSYLHLNNIVHRDIKPENLLLRKESDSIVIADFGFSRQEIGNLFQTKCGTPNYMAPEVLSCTKGYSGKKSDIWSCGVVLYAMLAGYLPFDSSSMSILCDKIETGKYYVSSKFSPNAKHLISKMLTVNPEDRYDMDEIMCHPFFTPGYVAIKEELIELSSSHIQTPWKTCSDSEEDKKIEKKQEKAWSGFPHKLLIPETAVVC